MARRVEVLPSEPVGRNGWTGWIKPRRKDFKLACCDCGVVHSLDFRLVRTISGGRGIQFRARRDAQATARQRKAMAV